MKEKLSVELLILVTGAVLRLALVNLPKQSDSNKKKGRVDVVVGVQWGDEGKGKLVDIVSKDYDICARVAGGSNAGHTIVIEVSILSADVPPIDLPWNRFIGKEI